MCWTGLLTGIGVALALASGAVAEPAAICQRGASIGPPTLDYALQQEAAAYYEDSYQRMDPGAFDPGEDAGWEAWHRAAILAQAIEWPGILADRAADLPKDAHDLPWLILLAEQEATYGSPVEPLLINPQSILLPDLIPLMRRHGLQAQADVLARAVALFADWELNPADRQLVIYGLDGTGGDPALQDRIQEISATYPQDGGAMAAALALLERQPDVAGVYHARMTASGAEASLDHLLHVLRTTCVTDWPETPDQTDRAYLSLGSAQAALLMMDDLAVSLDGTSAQMWLDGAGATMAPHLLKVLDLRGEEALAKGVRQAMADFPVPFPREMEVRWTVLEGLPPEAWDRIDTAMPDDAHDRLRAAMLALALETELLPDR